jgi:hypothetical protein
VEGVEQATQAERLVVGVCDDREDPPPGGECVMWRSVSALAAWGVSAVGGEQGRGDRRSVAAAADHPHLACWYVAELARIVSVDVVGGVGGLRQGQAAAHVVVVDVGLEHVGDAHPVLLGEGEDTVEVALRVDHQRDLAVIGEVAAVTKARGVDRNDLQHRSPPP